MAQQMQQRLRRVRRAFIRIGRALTNRRPRRYGLTFYIAETASGGDAIDRCRNCNQVFQEEKGRLSFSVIPAALSFGIYDELFKQDKARHVLVRHEQAAVHAADGYARSTDKVGVALVTSGPGATTRVTGIAPHTATRSRWW